MKLILSRKGFDSGYGGMPSPILPDGRMLSLPIPSYGDGFTLADLNVPNLDSAQLIADLSQGKHSLQTPVHLDPDLDRPLDKRLAQWRPSLGQTGNAQSHLRDIGVGRGDVFLFFGWFRQCELSAGKWRYVRGAPNLHVMFGWLEIAEVLALKGREQCLTDFPWIANHPHVANRRRDTDERNTLYVAAAQSRFSPSAAFGGGRFNTYDDALRLTKTGATRSVWSLPAWFMPQVGKPTLTYHPRPDQWECDGTSVTLRSAAKGQEFVLDGTAYPQVDAWLADLIRSRAS
jgi:hypothetical protein